MNELCLEEAVHSLRYVCGVNGVVVALFHQTRNQSARERNELTASEAVVLNE